MNQAIHHEIKILKRDSLIEGGFAGLKEHRLVKEPTIFGAQENNDGSWPGIGNFIYLADARFMPHGETHMHNHHEIDVISILVDGNISHEGSLENGQDLHANDVQVQRAGGEGFSHNEINPDVDWNRMIQLWVTPEQAGQAASYKTYRPSNGKLTRIYGGNEKSDFPADTLIDVSILSEWQKIKIEQPYIAYITRGNAIANNTKVENGDLMRGENLELEATNEVQIIIIQIKK